MEFSSMDNLTNDTAGWLGNSSSSSGEIEEAPSLVIALALSMCMWVVFANAAMVFLMSTRQTMSNSSTLQILSLAITDVIVGVSGLPLVMTFYIMGSFPYYATCAAIIGFYLTSQTATLFQMFGVCVCRVAASLRRSQVQKVQRPFLKLVLHIAIPWVVASMASITIILIYGVKDRSIRSCSLNSMFHDNYRKGTPLHGLMWLLTVILITLSYTFMCVRLILISRRTTNNDTCDASVRGTRAGKSSNSVGFSTIPQSSAPPVDECDISMSVPQCHDERPATSTNRNVPRPCVENSAPKTPSIIGTVPDSNCEHNRPNVPSSNLNLPNPSSENRKSKRARATLKSTFSNIRQWQKSMLITIGILLALMVMCITPYTIMMMMEYNAVQLMTRKTKFLLGTLSFFNSAMNPFVYGTRIQTVRVSVIRTWLRIRTACICSRVAAITIPQQPGASK